MNNAIKMSDIDSSVAIKGDILKFKEMYTKILKGAKVDECDLHLIDGDNKYDYLLSLKNEGMFKNFSSTKYPINFRKDTPESEVMLYRGNGIRDLINHFTKFISSYQREIAKFDLDK